MEFILSIDGCIHVRVHTCQSAYVKLILSNEDFHWTVWYSVSADSLQEDHGDRPNVEQALPVYRNLVVSDSYLLT